jgi:hypothetical protein
MLNYSKPKGWTVPFLLLVSTLCVGQAPLPEPVTDQETELGQAVYNQLKERGKIVESSPLYDTLRPTAEAISKEAQPRYNHPFKFFVVHETHPNAFATPGGNVYVVDSLFFFVKNTEQLAGTLCHEVSHTIHRDAVHRLKEQQRSERRELGAERRGAQLRVARRVLESIDGRLGAPQPTNRDTAVMLGRPFEGDNIT